jgi:hypothetical protein
MILFSNKILDENSFELLFNITGKIVLVFLRIEALELKHLYWINMILLKPLHLKLYK